MPEAAPTESAPPAAPRPPLALPAKVFRAGVTALLYFMLLGVVFWLLPKAEDVFRAQGMPLSPLTQNVIHAGKALRENIVTLPLLVGLGLLHGWAMCRSLRPVRIVAMTALIFLAILLNLLLIFLCHVPATIIAPADRPPRAAPAHS